MPGTSVARMPEFIKPTVPRLPSHGRNISATQFATSSSRNRMKHKPETTTYVSVITSSICSNNVG